MWKDWNIKRRDLILAGIFVLVATGALITMIGPRPKPTIFGSPSAAGLVLFSGGSGGALAGQFAYPRGVAFDREGHFFVADSRNSRIQKFQAADGKFVDDFGGFAKAEGDPENLKNNSPGRLNEPNDLTVGPAGEVIVADTWNHRVQVFSNKGRYKRMIIPEDGFFAPRGVAADADGNIFVADTGRHRVFKFDPKGKTLRVWGARGSKSAEFIEPIGLAVDQGGNIYVADRLNFRVQVFSNNGDFLRSIPVPGWSPEQVDMEPHLAVDRRRGVLYVTDGRGSKVHRFRLSGEVMPGISSDASGNGLFTVPLGVAVDDEGHVLVSDAATNRLLKLRGE
jgi:tripartite motif-containing protein 71